MAHSAVSSPAQRRDAFSWKAICQSLPKTALRKPLYLYPNHLLKTQTLIKL